jgi:hypothetical protein
MAFVMVVPTHLNMLVGLEKLDNQGVEGFHIIE